MERPFGLDFSTLSALLGSFSCSPFPYILGLAASLASNHLSHAGAGVFRQILQAVSLSACSQHILPVLGAFLFRFENQCCGSGSVGSVRFWVPDPHLYPLVRETDPDPVPDPSIIKQK